MFTSSIKKAMQEGAGEALHIYLTELDDNFRKAQITQMMAFQHSRSIVTDESIEKWSYKLINNNKNE